MWGRFRHWTSVLSLKHTRPPALLYDRVTMMEEDLKRIAELRSILAEANRQYYVDNAPAMSDYDFDMLMKELTELEKKYPEAVTPDSPTLKVGSDLTREFERRPHKYPMLSLGNTYAVQEVVEFADRVSKSLGGESFSYCCELKFDGTAICLTYHNGLLVRALTRGDGQYGDDVTENVKHISNIPQRLQGVGIPEDFEIRGEIYMPYKAFDRLNQERIENEDPPFANPRNAASGSLKLLDPKEVGHRGLECTLYHLLGENLPFETHRQALDAAKSWGLPVSDKFSLARNIREIEEFILYWDTERHNLPFATDGIVIKVNELPFQKSLGYTSKFPRWAVAYKFKAEQALTEVLSIDYQVGRTGAVTPVANLSPVPLSGTIVKRATLHNAEQMDILDIRVGDFVYVEKGGEIIPKITSVELERRKAGLRRPVFPTRCPDCGTPLVRDDGEAKWFCPNTYACPTQIKARLVHFLSRKAMNVIAGDATIEQMYNLNLVKSPADFYSLDREKLSILDGWKEKSVERFLKSIRESLKVPFEKVLFALGIRYVGETTAKTLSRHFGSIDALASASRDELLSVEDVGDVIADSILRFFSDPKIREDIERLRKAGVTLSTERKSSVAGGALAGKIIVISGNFSVSRDEMKAMIELNGGRNSSSVSGKTDYLLAGTKPGPEKIKKANELSVKIIDEAEFRRLVHSGVNGGMGFVTDGDGTADKADSQIHREAGGVVAESDGGTETHIIGEQLSLF